MRVDPEGCGPTRTRLSVSRRVPWSAFSELRHSDLLQIFDKPLILEVALVLIGSAQDGRRVDRRGCHRRPGMVYEFPTLFGQPIIGSEYRLCGRGPEADNDFRPDHL